MKFVYIHPNVEDDELLLAAFNRDCIVKKASEWTDVLAYCNDISHFAFVYKHARDDNLPFFEDREPSAYPYFNQGVIDLFQGLKSRNPSIIIDILTCNLNKPSFAVSVAKIQTDLAINIRYSLDQTGNAPEGNWILESDGVDVKDMYFTELITMWTGVLDVISGASSTVVGIAYDSTYIYIGGVFTAVSGVGRNRLARYTKDGRLDMTWNPNANNNVNTIAINATHLYVGGLFTVINGSTVRNRIARIPLSSPTGIVDATWNPNVSDSVETVLVDDDNVYIAGQFVTINGGTTRNRIARIPLSSPTGIVDGSWDPNADNIVYALAIDSANIYFGGQFTTVNGATIRNRIARISKSSSTGTVDISWDPNVANNLVDTIAVNASHVYIGGTFTLVNTNVTRNRIARFPLTSSTGVVDGTWNPNANGTVNIIILDSTYIYVGGGYSNVGGVTRNRIARIPLSSTTGTADSWNPNSNSQIINMVLDGNNIYIGGFVMTIFGVAVSRFVIYDIVRDRVIIDRLKGFQTGGVEVITYDSDYVYIGGQFTIFGQYTRNRIARVSKISGLIDLTWNPNTNNTVSAIVFDSTYIYIGGAFTTVGGLFRNGLARMLKTSATGAIDLNWNPNVTGTVERLATDSSNLYVAGLFTAVSGVPRNNIARISLSSSDGTVNGTWNPNADGRVSALAVDTSHVYIGGLFLTLNGGTSRTRLARIPTDSADGTVDTWNPNVNGRPFTIVLDDTHIYVVGAFTQMGGINRNFITRFLKSSPSSVDANWNPNAGAIVRSIAFDASYIYVGGEFTTMNGSTTRNRIARIPFSSSTGTVDATWDPNANNTVSTVTADSTNIYFGGSFASVTNTTSLDLFGISVGFTMTNPYISSSRTVLTNNGITNQTAITSKTINQGDLVTDSFVDFSTIAAENRSAVRHALLSLLQEYNFYTTAFYMPKVNLGLSGSGNTLVYLPYQSIDIATLSTGSSAYINLYVTGDYITFLSGSTTKTITKTASGYLLDGVTYADGDTVVLYSLYPIVFGGVYIPASFNTARIQMVGKGAPVIKFKGRGLLG